MPVWGYVAIVSIALSGWLWFRAKAQALFDERGQFLWAFGDAYSKYGLIGPSVMAATMETGARYKPEARQHIAKFDFVMAYCALISHGVSVDLAKNVAIEFTGFLGPYEDKEIAQARDRGLARAAMLRQYGQANSE